MMKRSLLTAGLIAASLSNVYALPYGFYDARSVGMGNVSVATGGITTAAFSNPAMLMVNESNDVFAFHVGAGAAFIENGDITDDIDRFQDVEDQINLINTNDVLNAEILLDLLNQQIQIINDLNGDSLLGRASPNLALTYGGDSFSVAVTAEVNAFASGVITNVTGVDPLTLTDIENDITNNGALTFDPSAELTAIGAVTTEIGVAIATDFSILGMDISVGVKPKTISAEAISF